MTEVPPADSSEAADPADSADSADSAGSAEAAEGVGPADAVDAADAAGDDDGVGDPALARLVEAILGGPTSLTRDEVATAAGITVEEARPFWRAMGFADVGTTQAFTEGDLAAMNVMVRWVRDGLMDSTRAVEVIRSLGQTAVRLADWQVDTMGRILATLGDEVTVDEVADGLTDLLPELESLLVHVWRRHLAAAVSRELSTRSGTPGSDVGAGTVGFADIASFTRLTRVLQEDDLAAMVEAFETGAADIVAGHGARMVKTLGDEVMFLADSPDTAVSIAAALHRLPLLTPTDRVRLQLRIGLATGRLVSLMGDYYGDTVNRASRLTAVARPGHTWIDPATEDALADPSDYVIRHHRPRALRGLGLVRASSIRLRHPPEAEAPPAEG